MSEETKPKKPRSTKSKAALEAKIAELEAKLNQLSSQVKPAEVRTTTPPEPKPKKASKPAPSPGEVAPAYATISTTGYTGNKYYATRARLAYHPPDKQFKGEAQATVQVAPAPPKPKRGTLPAGFKP